MKASRAAVDRGALNKLINGGVCLLQQVQLVVQVQRPFHSRAELMPQQTHSWPWERKFGLKKGD